MTVPLDMPVLTPTALHEDRQGSLWLGTREKGLYRFDRTGVATVVLAQQTILNITEDREGNLWVGSRGGGLSQVKPRVAELLAPGTGVPFGGVRSVCQDTAGQLWAVIWPNGEVMRGAGQDWSSLTVRDGWSVHNAKCVEADPKGGVWIGTEYAGLHRWQDGVVTDHFGITNGLGTDMVSALRVTGSGAVWIGTCAVEERPQVLQCLEDRKFQTFSLPSGSGLVVVLATDAAGDCWAATSRGRLLRVRKGVLTDETAQTLGAPTEIRCLLGTPDGSLWVGTGGQGLGRLKDGRFSRCRMAQGLRDDYISNMLPDGLGRLWFAGNRGIFSAREKDLIDLMDGRSARVWTAAYGRNEGMLRLQASYDSWPGAVRGADGRLFFAMQSGLAVVYAAQVKADQEPPPVLIEQVKVNGKTVAAYGAAGGPAGTEAAAPAELGRDGVHLRLAPGRRQVEFAFTALGFNMPEALGFRYRLQGFDTEWNEAGTRRSATYSQLPPGHYRFEVTACSSDGLWNKTGAALELTAEPFWWETSWFFLASLTGFAACVGGVTWAAVRLRNRRRIEKMERLHALDQERSRIARDIHDELGSYLTRIAWLSELAGTDKELPDQVEIHSGKIGGYARQMVRSLDEIVWAVNPRNDTLQSLAQYLTYMAHEYLSPTSVNCRLDIQPDLPEVSLSSATRRDLLLIAKEALHNILKHAAAGEARIGLSVTDGVLTLAVEDNGRGFDPAVPLSGRAGHGLENLRQRIVNLGGGFRCDSAPGQGTRLTFTLKLPEPD
ncbi:MAG: two-component regulator propeller domain-containing protein [bacterium]